MTAESNFMSQVTEDHDPRGEEPFQYEDQLQDLEVEEEVRSKGIFGNITIYHQGNYSPGFNVVALFDTWVPGNWISLRAVKILGADGSLKSGEAATFRTVGGVITHALGTIELEWTLTLNPAKTRRAIFNVFDSLHRDVIFGNEYLMEIGFLSRKPLVSYPLTKATTATLRKLHIPD
jgi:hypothetical protein